MNLAGAILLTAVSTTLGRNQEKWALNKQRNSSRFYTEIIIGSAGPISSVKFIVDRSDSFRTVVNALAKHFVVPFMKASQAKPRQLLFVERYRNCAGLLILNEAKDLSYY